MSEEPNNRERHLSEHDLLNARIAKLEKELEEAKSALLNMGKPILPIRTFETECPSWVQEVEQRLADIIEFLPDATFVIDQEKRVIAWNRACENITGVKKEKMLGLGDYAYAVPFLGEKRPILIDLLDKKIYEVESAYKYVRREDGKIYGESFMPELGKGKGAHLWAVAAPLYDQNGNRSGAIEVVRDVTEQINVENELQDSRDRLLKAQRVGKIGFFDWNLKTNEVYLSDEAYELIGLQPDGGVLKTDATNKMVHPDDRAYVQENLKLALEGVKPYDITHRYVRSDGGVLWGHTQAELFWDASGAPVRLLGTIVDVTKQKQGEEDLRASEQKYRELVENANSIIMRWNREGKVTFLNEFGQEFFGYTEKEIHGRPVMGTIVPMSESGGRDLKSLMDKICSDPKAYEKNLNENMKRNGERVWIAWTNKVVEGPTTEVLSVGVDVTYRMKSEAERGKLEEQLRVSQKMEAVGSLAGGVAHDFNNLLSVIRGFTEMAMMTAPSSASLNENLQEVINACDRAAALTRQLLAFSRKQMLHPITLNLNQVITGFEKMLRRIIGEDIEIKLDLAPDLGLTMADPGQIEQVLMNLVVNSRDAMPKGGKVTLETSNVEIDEEYAKQHVGLKPGPHVLLVVTDTGCGMDEKIKRFIFEPFFTTKEKGKGTGLGLSTVYGIIKQSGGDIFVYSESGHGTAMKIYLPRVMAGEAQAPSHAITRIDSKGNETILVVDDEPALLEVARLMLNLAGYKVLIARNGEEALQISGRHPGEIQLLLTDVVMKGMNGKELAEGLLKTRPGVKTLYMSGYTDKAIVNQGALDHSAYFIAKPFSASELTHKVRSVLNGDAAH